MSGLGMAINTGWADDPEQRYWMEITQRDVLGENLLAPQVDGAGHEQWSHTLVRVAAATTSGTPDVLAALPPRGDGPERSDARGSSGSVATGRAG
jgi:hypothetical protein